LGLDADALSTLAGRILLGGFLGARLVHVFLYRWVDYQDNLGDIIKLWEGGLSSYGAFAGAVVVGVWYLRKRDLNVLQYGDVVIYACMPGWTLGRAGCFVIHDHPGQISDFFLAAQMKLQALGDSAEIIAPRHDLGLYDGLLTLAITIIFWQADRKPRWAGFYMAWSCILYAVPRFFLDFLRATDLSWSDARYLGLTPAQYGSIILLTLGGWILWSQKQEAT
jgi:phosphatidylglycerol:prolipoprotein diacylglycerol transferase